MLFSFQKFLARFAFVAFALPVLRLVAGEASPNLKGKRYVVERDGVDHHVFEHDPTGSKIDVVKNSGICETTPGVNQYSGYFSVGSKSTFRSMSTALNTYRKYEYVVLVFRIPQ
jgi:hypothetical protein